MQTNKSTSLEERLAYVLSRRGIQKFNKATMGAGMLPALSFILMSHPETISDATPMPSVISIPGSGTPNMPKIRNTAN